MTCRHCHVRRANRPRQLCFSCYYAPGVRDLYPTDARYRPPQLVPDRCGVQDPPEESTGAPPGSPEKIAVLCERALAGRSLWHRGDGRGE